MAVEIRRVRPGDEAALRALRLRALTDAAAAFASSAEIEAGQPDAYWAQLADTAAIFVAVSGEAWLGMGAGRWFDRQRGIAQLWGMWVDPVARRAGVGAGLVAAVEGWARDGGATTVRLGVIEGVAGAQAFYARLGFTPTGETRALPFDPGRTALFMSRAVSY